MFAPFPARCRAISRPTRLAAPVTRAVLPRISMAPILHNRREAGKDNAYRGCAKVVKFLFERKIPMSLFDKKHGYPGKLFIVEGLDGSGKSTQISLLKKWLDSEGYSVFFTEWNSSELVKETTREGKKKNILTPTTFSLLHATDFADRLNYQIIPPLKAGMIVLADRYAYTAFARDVVRGVHPDWIRKVYSFAIQPDITFYFRVPIEVACERILDGRTKLKFFEAGMDFGF